MPKPYEHVRLVLSGTILSTQTWSMGMSLALTDSPPVAFNSASFAAWVTGRLAAFTAWWQGTDGPGKMNPADVKATKLTAYFYPANASSALLTAEAPFSTALPGTGVPILPTQTSAVITTLTGLSGRHYRGRMYVPATGVVMIADHKMSSQTTAALATLTKTLFDSINASTIGAAAVRLIVASQTATPAAITTLRVDNEADVQRRRANKILASAYSSSTLAA